jgi:WD40 repeat protein
MKARGSHFTTVAFSPDARRVLLGGSDGRARVWPVEGAPEPVAAFAHPSGASIRAASFASDGERVVTAASDGEVRVWTPEADRETVVLQSHAGPARAARFSPDGTRVVAGAQDGAVRVWRADGSGEALVLRGGDGPVVDVAFSPDGARVLALSQDGTVCVWALDPGRLMEWLWRATSHCLSAEERVRRLGEEPEEARRNHEAARAEVARRRARDGADHQPTAARAEVGS